MKAGRKLFEPELESGGHKLWLSLEQKGAQRTRSAAVDDVNDNNGDDDDDDDDDTCAEKGDDE